MFTDYLKSLNSKETKDLIENDKYYFDDYGKIYSNDIQDYDENENIKSPDTLYNAYKTRTEVIDGIQKGLNTLKITDYENKALKNDALFGKRTQSAWDKFAEKELQNSPNYLKNVLNASKGLGTSLKSDPLWSTDYKVIDRDKIFKQYVNEYGYKKKGDSILKNPDGSFGIAHKKINDINIRPKDVVIKSNGRTVIEPRINALYRIDPAHFPKNNKKLTALNHASGINHQNIDHKYFDTKDYNKFTGKFSDLPENVLNSKRPETSELWARLIGNAKLKDKDGFSLAKEVEEKISPLDYKPKKGEPAGWRGLVDHKPIKPSTLKLASQASDIKQCAKIGGKALGYIGAAADIYNVASVVYKDIKDDDTKINKKTVSTLSNSVGGWLGGIGGAKGGAAIGAWAGGVVAGAGTLGTMAPLGALIGGSIGGVLGGIAGGISGGLFAEKVSENIYDSI